MTLKVIRRIRPNGNTFDPARTNQLGFPCYHMVEVIRNKDNKTHLDFWRRVANSPPGSKQD